MSGVYTNIAKKRSEQSKHSMAAPLQVPPIQIPTLGTESNLPEAQKPPVSPPPRKQNGSKEDLPKKQISAYLTLPQHRLFKQLYHQLNSTDANVDKGEIVGLSLEVLSAVIADNVPNFPTLVRLRKYLLEKVSKA
jgi:hypothetical protein